RRQGAGLERHPGRDGVVAEETGDADVAIVLVVPGGEVLVGEGPVGLATVLRALAEVGGAEAGPGVGEVDTRTADTLPHRGRLVNGVDRVILVEATNVGAGVPVGGALPLPIGGVMRVILGPDPRALFKADDLESGFGENAGRDGAANAGADDENVHGVVL